MSACRSACHNNNFRKSRVGRDREDPREDVRVGVGVGVMEFQLFGPRSFAACARQLWNSLPPSLRDLTLSLTLFCSRLKTHLFGLTYRSALVAA